VIYRIVETDGADRGADSGGTAGRVSTGSLPARPDVAGVLDDAYERYRDIDDGEVADYIPVLARTPPDLFGASVVSVSGEQVAVGDSAHPFSIQSVSKPFVFALVVEALGAGAARELLGVNATGLPFSSVMAVELNEDRTINPMVNAGAIAATSLALGDSPDDKWAWIRDGLSRFAGHPLELDEEVYESEAATNLRNQGIAHLLQSYGRLYFDPDAATDVYTRQCSLLVSAEDLAVMAATLADGGVNPRTGAFVVSPATCTRVLAVMATAGLYENTGDWMYEVGLPGKSGVSGGIVTVAPGKGGMATFSPRLDDAGNSIRGQLVTRFVSDRLGLNIFASAPAG
jgi:glutaminase